MDQLINVVRKTNGEIAVNAKDLYNFLEIKTPFRKWISRMLINYGFIENVDYEVSDKKVRNLSGGRPSKVVILTLDCAKEIAMVQRNHRGRQARKYFIHIQKLYENENPVSELVKAPKSKILSIAANAEKQYERVLPKAQYYDKSMRNPGTMSATVIAKDFGMSATQLNKLLKHYGIIYRQGYSWVLYAKYQKMKLGSYSSYDYGGNHYVNELWKWNQRGKKFIHDLLNSHGYLLNSEQLDLLNNNLRNIHRKHERYGN